MKIAIRILFATCLSVASLPGALIGILNWTGDVNVSVNGVGTTLINFLPTGSATGDIQAGTSNSGSFTPINVETSPNRQGMIKDFSNLTVLPIANWIQFGLLSVPFSTMNVRLDGLVPSAAPVGCVVVASGTSCTPFAGSIFTFINDPGGAIASFRGFGVVIDGVDSSPYTVLVSTQFVGRSISAVLGDVAGPNGVQASYSANLSTVPEPSTWAMALIGFGGVLLSRRRRR